MHASSLCNSIVAHYLVFISLVDVRKTNVVKWRLAHQFSWAGVSDSILDSKVVCPGSFLFLVFLGFLKKIVMILTSLLSRSLSSRSSPT